MKGKALKKEEVEAYIDMIRQHGCSVTAKLAGKTVRHINAIRQRYEKQTGTVVKVADLRSKAPDLERLEEVRSRARVHFNLDSGVVLVGSDAHYRPGVASTAHRALVKFCREMRPRIVVKNGDALDFPRISRFPVTGWAEWEKMPSVAAEIKCTQERLTEIEDAAAGAKLTWPIGNHDSRFEMRVASQVPELANITGIHLKDHFPRWTPCMSTWVNNDVVIKHRWHNGIHAVRNNALKAGLTMVTGHLHSLKVTPITDYRGTRFGIDTGTMADPFGDQFDYCEDNPRDWRSGFVVLTFYKGKLLWPEVVHVLEEGLVEFRGQVIKV